MTRAGTAAVVVASFVALGASAAILHARDSQFPRTESQERLMYLRSSRAASRVMLSFDSIASDVYWIRAIQHYGRDRRAAHTGPKTAHEFELLKPLLDLTTSLDPRFNIAYRFGAIFLSLPFPDGPGRVDEAIALLEKGLTHTPDRYQYALDIGYLHYWYTGDSKAAAAWFERAAAMPNAPPWIHPIAAATLAQGGDRNGARQLLREQQKSEEKWIRQAAERALLQLTALDYLDALRARVDVFYNSQHRYPNGWQDLIQARLLTGIVADPSGTPFEYDTQSNSFHLSDKSPLFPLPEVFARR